MADKKISQLTGATTPLAGTEVLPIVQGGNTVKVSVANLTAGRTVDATTVNATTVDATSVEVTNIKAKDGTAAASIADSTGVVTVTAAPVMSALTASQAVFTTSGKALVSNAITGTGNVVMSASPTLTGTIDAAAQTLSGNLTLNGGTANGVLYLNGSKVATSGSALTFTSDNYLLLNTTGTTGNGKFANAHDLATLAAVSTARTYTKCQDTAASNNATVDVFTFSDAAGNLMGGAYVAGHFYVYVTGASGANAFAGVYSIITTGNGTSQATLASVSTVTRGTSPVSSVQIAADGVGGAIKLTITYINNSGVVTGGSSKVSFVGLSST